MARFSFSLRQSLRFRKAFFVAALLCAASAFGSPVVWAAATDSDDDTDVKVVVNSLELGKDNDLEGDGIITIGDGNEQSSSKGTVVGWENISRGTKALTIGSSNVVNGDGAMSFGIGNENEGQDTLSVGKGNIITIGGDENNHGRVVGIGYGNKATGENLVAVGIDTRANVKNASAFGVKSSAHGDGAVSLGYGNEATVNPGDENSELRPNGLLSAIKYSSTALGAANNTGGNNSSAVGFGNEAQGNYVAAVGTGNKAYGFQSSAFGFQNIVESGHKSSAMGSDNIIGGEHNTGLGYNNRIAGYIEATAVGSTNKSYGNYAAAFGYNNSISGFANSTAIGNNNVVSSEYGTVLGSGNNLSSPDSARSIVLGVNNTNYRGNSVLLGHDNKFEYGGTNSYIIGGNNEIWGDKAVVLGEGNQTTGTRAIVIGVDSHIWNSDSITLGNENNSGALQSAIVGNKSGVWAENGLAFGNESTVNGANGVLLGNKSLANAANSVAIGNQSISLGEGALSIGNISTSNGAGSYVVGNNSGAYSENSFALGNNAVSIAADSVAVGNQSVASESNTVSFGHKAGEQKGTDSDAVYDSDLTSRLLNVTAGIDDTDAVNVSQLNTERQVRLDSDVVLQDNIDAEKAARENAVAELNDALNTQVGTLTAKDTELEGQIGDLNAALTAEAGRLSAKDAELENKIISENTARSEADAALGSRIDAVSGVLNDLSDSAVKYDSGTNKGKVTLVGLDGTLVDNVKAGTLSADSKEAVNGSQLYFEQEARKAADDSLQSNIDAEKSAREAAVNGVIDSFDVKANTLTAKDNELDNKITAEKGTRESEVSRLDERIDSINISIGNIDNAVYYDDGNKGKITLAGLEGTVIDNVKPAKISVDSKEAVNGSQLYTEQEARKSADTALQNNIDVEKVARENAVAEVTDALNTQVGTLTAKDTELEGQIGDLNVALTAEAGRLSVKDVELENKITSENTARSEADAALDSRIDTVSGVVNDLSDSAVKYDSGTNKGKVTLVGLDGTLVDNVKAGTLSADSKEAVNGSQLYFEQEARKAADDSLQSNIDAEKSAREAAVNGAIDSFDVKANTLTAKDNELEDKITAEKGVRESEVSRLDERIDGINTSIGNIDNAVYYDDSNKDKVTLAGTEGTLIDNVKAAKLSADSKEAVNGSQLYTEQEARKAADDSLWDDIRQEAQVRQAAVDAVDESLRTNVKNLEQKDAEIQKSIADETKDRIEAVRGLRDELTNFVDVSLENVVTYTDLTKTKVSLGRQGIGVLVTNLKDGDVSRGSSDAVTGNQLYEEQQHRRKAIENINSRIDNIEAAAGGNSVAYDDEDRSSVTLGGDDGTVIKNLADGTVAEGSKEAVNGGQLYDEVQARIDADNALRQEFGDYVAGITEDSVSYDKDSDKSKVTFKGTEGTILGNVAGGSIAEGSKEAVNGGQLYETNTKLEDLTSKVGTVKDGTFVKEKNAVGENINSLDEAVSANSSAIDEMGGRMSSGFSLLNSKVNNTGAHAAALAALHPVADDDSKVGFAAGLGSYHNSRAAAVGMFYRPSDRYQFSLGGTTGNGEHMYNLGFSVGLDKVIGGPFSSKKAMVREIVSLREEVEELRAMLKASLGRGN